MAGLPAGLLAQALGLGGGSCTLDAACASSLYAIKLAVDELLAGRADAMLTGGVSRPDPLYTQMGFSQLRALSTRGICSPFDAAGDGLVVGEGAGLFLLKRTEDALAHGDRIYGIIRGIGLANDVGGSLLAPLSEGQLRAMRAAYARAGWNPQDVDLIECHATGTPVGDATEFASLRELWGDSAAGRRRLRHRFGQVQHRPSADRRRRRRPDQGAAGHGGGDAPAHRQFHHSPAGMDLDASPFRVLTERQPWQRRGEGIPRRAAVSAFGFGGINAHLLVEEWLPGANHALAVQRSAFSVNAQPEVPPHSAPGAPHSIPIAVVGMDARFGPWQSLRAFQERVLGGDQAVTPATPRKWWGAQESDWFRAEGLGPHPLQRILPG